MRSINSGMCRNLVAFFFLLIFLLISPTPPLSCPPIPRYRGDFEAARVRVSPSPNSSSIPNFIARFLINLVFSFSLLRGFGIGGEIGFKLLILILIWGFCAIYCRDRRGPKPQRNRA